MKLVITIDTDNAAFNHPNWGMEVNRILDSCKEYLAVFYRDPSTVLTSEVLDYPLRDINGNTVGHIKQVDPFDIHVIINNYGGCCNYVQLFYNEPDAKKAFESMAGMTREKYQKCCDSGIFPDGDTDVRWFHCRIE